MLSADTTSNQRMASPGCSAVSRVHRGPLMNQADLHTSYAVYSLIGSKSLRCCTVKKQGPIFSANSRAVRHEPFSPCSVDPSHHSLSDAQPLHRSRPIPLTIFDPLQQIAKIARVWRLEGFSQTFEFTQFLPGHNSCCS